MASTDVEIANQALLMLGQKVIQDLAEDTPEALAVRTYYEDARDHTLRDIKPSFAVKRSADLALSANDPPEFGFDHAHALPIDNLLVITINLNGGSSSSLGSDLGEQQFREWRVEGQDILSDRANIKILYIHTDVDIESLMDSSYVKALAAYLAAEMSYTLTESTTKFETMMALYDLRKNDAGTTYGQESSTVRTINDQITLVR